MIKELRNYKSDITVGPDLEDEWITQPSNYIYYAEEYTLACDARDDIKLEMEWVAANIDLDIRKNWDTDKGREKYGFDSKPSENAIKNTILIDKEYFQLYKQYNKAVKKVNSMTGVKTAFEHKKKALENLVSLKITGMYSEPKNKVRDVKKLVESKIHQKQKDKLNEKMKSKRRENEKSIKGKSKKKM